MSPPVPPRPDQTATLAAEVALPPGTAAHAPLALSSASLLRGARELVIRHGAELYRLRHTRNDKLILTK